MRNIMIEFIFLGNIKNVVTFMIISAPRSGTGVAANWLSTDTTLCLHDALFNYHYSSLNSLSFQGKKLGIADTGIWIFPSI